VALTNAPSSELYIPRLTQLRLNTLCEGRRYTELDRLDAYAECRQYDALRYNWDGNMMGYAGDADIQPGWYVPLERRRPNVRYNLGKLIITRLTAMALGEESWPELTVPGDQKAEDYIKALAKESRLKERLQEARTKGGGSGTAVLSFSFVDGVPRVKCHEAKHMHVVQWADRDEHVIRSVLKCYRYSRTVWVDSQPREKWFYFARYWDESREVVWDPIPDELARTGAWASRVRSYEVQHGYGECPVYWAQNLPDSEREDGISDIDGLSDTFDSVNRLLSATTKGTIANVDPTLVIRDDPGKNAGVVRKGSGQAIWAKGGAEYLELRGESVKTARELANTLVAFCLNTAGVVVGDPEKMGVKAQSSLALKMLYLPMCNQCDILRTQYGGIIQRILRGMIRAARKINATAPGAVIETSEGHRLQHQPVVLLPPKVETVEGEETVTELQPGESERLELSWPQYFPPTLEDIGHGVTAAVSAIGKTIARKTAVKFTGPFFGVEDIDQELADIDVEREAQALLMGELDAQEPTPGFGGGGGDGSAET
jgi:hypothetical protein